MYKYIPKMKQTFDEVKSITSKIKQHSCFQNERPEQLANLEKQLIVLQIYLDDAIDRCESRDKFLMKIKNELSIMALIFLAVGLVTFLMHLAH